MLKLTCPHCQSQFTFALVPPGTPVRCRACKQSFTTPAGDGKTTATPENIFGPLAGRAAVPAPPSPPPAPVPAPVSVQPFAPVPARPAPAPAPAVVFPRAPEPVRAPTVDPVHEPVFARRSEPAAEPEAAPALPEKALPKSMRGPLEAETAHVCPKCGLTSVALRGGGPPWWVSHSVGVVLLTVLLCVLPLVVGLAIGIAAWVLAFFVLNILLHNTPGFKCTTCAHVWE
jgi:hypothetical protein